MGLLFVCLSVLLEGVILLAEETCPVGPLFPPCLLADPKNPFFTRANYAENTSRRFEKSNQPVLDVPPVLIIQMGPSVRCTLNKGSLSIC
jgi:hypothetical protein